MGDYFEFQISEKLLQFLGLAVVFLGVIFLSTGAGIFNLPELNQNTGLLLIFITGVLTSFHCIGMCGSLVVAYVTNQGKGQKNDSDKKSKFIPHIQYNTAKLFSYTLMGAIVGAIGSLFNLTGTFRGYMAVFAGLFMVIMGLNMLNIFPWLRKLTPRMPNVAGKIGGKRKGPIFLGLLTGLMPCGPLQAMLLFAAGSGSISQGALTMFVFGLGTLPLMFIFGSFTSMISRKMTRNILKFSAIIVLTLGLIMLNRGLVLAGSPVALSTLNPFSSKGAASSTSNGYQEINMKVTRYGWEPDTFVVKKNVPVKWNIEVEEVTYCNKELVFSAFGIDQKFSENGEKITLEFTPTSKGKFSFSCWMGMIPGMIVVE